MFPYSLFFALSLVLAYTKHIKDIGNTGNQNPPEKKINNLRRFWLPVFRMLISGNCEPVYINAKMIDFTE